MFHQNQLQFHLNVPNLPNNLAARYRNPGPLVIEKLGGDTATKTESRKPKEHPVKFTAISEDRLSTAIRLAKRDLKNILAKRQTPDNINELSHQEQKQTKKSKSKRSPSGKNHRQLRDPTNSRIRERYTNPNENQRSIETQTLRAKSRHARNDSSSQPVNTYGLVLNVQHQDRRGDATRGLSNRVSLSPFSKEVLLSPNSRQAQEIRRLRSELKTYMRKVEELSIKAYQQRTDSAKKDEEDAEDDPRRAARAAEQASRSARLLYSLQRQVREIQDELDKLGPGKVRHTKKSRALSRLAAAHRGAVRALQSFLHYLPSEMEPGSGLPPHYQELALLIRQLSLCSSQLDVDETGIPEGVLNILEQAKDFQDALSQQMSTPPRPNQASHSNPSLRRRLAFENNAVRVPSSKPQSRAVTLKSLSRDRSDANSKFPNPHQYRVREMPVKDTDKYRDRPHITPGPAMVERLRQTVINNKATPGSPERNEALRAGLEALLRAGGHTPGPAKPTQPAARPPHPGAHVPQPAAKARKPPSAKGPAPASKSLILPAKLKAARERLQRARPIPRDAHFTQETVASKLKHREPAGQSNDPGARPEDDGSVMAAQPAWTPPGSPRSFHKVSSPRPQHVTVSSEDEEESVKDREHSQRERSPRRRKVIFNVEEKSQDGDDAGRGRESRLDPDLMQREIARQAWLDREAAKQIKHLDSQHETDRYPPVPPHWLEEVEKALSDRLRPLIDKAESTAKEQQRLENTRRQSLLHQLSQKTVQATSNNADLLSDLLLEDILADTALEFHRIESHDKLEQQARQLQDAPTMEGMLQSLEKMELMEDEIRRRWKRVEYIDQKEIQADSIRQREARWMMGTPLDGDFLESFQGAVPTSHTSMKFTNSPKHDDHRSYPRSLSSKPSHDTEIPPKTERIQIYSSEDDNDYNMGARPQAQDDVWFSEEDSKDTRRYLSQEIPVSCPGPALDRSHQLNVLQDLLGTKATTSRQNPSQALWTRHKSDARPTLDRPKFPLFIPSDTMNRIKDHRGRFEHHLKSTSHWAYGTFDPWKLVEEVSDEIVSEIIKDVSSEVSDIMSHCVDDLYKAEFDMT